MENNTTFLELISFLNKVQEQGKYTVFYNMSGHINWFNIRLFYGKWTEKKKPIFDKDYKITKNIISMDNFGVTSWEEVIQEIKVIVK